MTSLWPVIRRFGFVTPIAILVSAAASNFATPPTFSTTRLINTPINGLLPFEVRTEDIDRDGDIDVYTANYSGRVAWYENSGGNPPSWLEHVLTDFADGAEGVVAVRVDGDADIDILSAAFNLDEIAWYDNGGNGQTWTAKPITFSAHLAVDVWAADLDRDGDNDAISLSGYDGRVEWYENLGNNAWGLRLLAPGGASSLETADLDQDGDLDVVSGSVSYESDGGSPPTFTSRVLTTVPTDIADASAVVDVDRDGDPDVVGASQELDHVTWYENDGMWPPGWTSHVVSTTADFGTGAYAADLDGDGDVDILSSSFFDNTIAWYENDGGSPPSWTERAISTAAPGARSVFAADLEGDGDMDVLSATQNDAKVTWHVNEANYPDADRDGMRDELDCAAANATAFAVPKEVSGVRFRTTTLLEWNSATAGSGSGARHDVMRGALSQLPPGSGPAEACLANDAAVRSMTEAAIPPPGSGFYYLVRTSNACGTGSYGARSSGVPRNTGVCP